jgi:predicted AAA+ superfamily ATPase
MGAQNVVYHKLSAKYENLFYYKDAQGYEVDFVVMEQGEVKEMFQVCYDPSDEMTGEREIRALKRAQTKLSCDNMNLIVAETARGWKVENGINLIKAENFLLE